ncbi:hypothetical protein Thivi_4610 [Thiocystis violascens DSM 198]|uniref:Uncharacterized protein n=1 Tax=Thiocystis violascens (strain ATCC 17096 / DSM 198 / 6111) TaxID=765911 RepID=I3YHD3_THIV6|nr:hypothetical protein Thivi_4610 [Thiocystis violascens DSM 198]
MAPADGACIKNAYGLSVTVTPDEPVKPGIEPVTVTTEPITPVPVTVTDKTARDRRILELSHLSEMKVAAILQQEGFKCSPRTIGNVRKNAQRAM